MQSDDNAFVSRIKLSHQSFRIEKEVIDLLGSEAIKRGVSLSSLVNKILKNYITSEMYFEELGFVPVSRDFLRRVFSEVDETKLDEVGRELGIAVAREYVSYFYSVVNCETLVRFLDLWFKRFQSFQHRVDNNTVEEYSVHEMPIDEVERGARHFFALNHDINYNFSVVLKAMLEGLIEPIVKGEVRFGDLTPNSLAFWFDVKEVT